MGLYEERLEEEKEFRQELSELFTDVKDSHFQRCHLCNSPLITLSDHYGAGSHYWVLACGDCVIRFVYDTYEFKLRTWPKEGQGQTVARWGKTEKYLGKT